METHTRGWWLNLTEILKQASGLRHGEYIRTSGTQTLREELTTASLPSKTSVHTTSYRLQINNYPVLIHFCAWIMSRDSLVGTATDYELDNRIIGVRLPGRVTGKFSLHRCVQTGSGANPASSPMGIGGSFTGVKAAGPWSWPLTSI
jgi:hypothetical protein